MSPPQESEAITPASQPNGPSIFDLGSASHELRAPLHAILGLAELLVERVMDGADRELAERIRNEARAMEVVLSDLVEFSRLESDEVALIAEPFSPRIVVGEATALHGDRAHAKGLELRMDVGEDTPLAVRGDRYRLRQILVNLISNAVKYTDTGSVTVTADAGGERETPELTLSVIDTGPGIPDDALPQLFTPFTQARSGDREQGTGLGLAITRRLVDAMGGSLDIQTSPRGTTFTVVLPFLPARRIADRTAAARSGPSLSPFAARKARILVVDDTEVNRLLATSQLERLGYQSVAVDSGVAALAHLAVEPVDAVLMDWHMPGLDGLAATREWREKSTSPDYDGPNRAVPIIAVTASALATDRGECLAAGMDDYLAKPIGLEVLGDCLSKWLPGVDPDTASETATAPEESVEINPDRLTSLLGDLGADAVSSVVTAFLDDLPRRSATMTRAHEADDRAVVRRTAHTVKSSAALFGAAQLESVASALESGAAATPESGPPPALDRLVADFVRLVPLTATALEAQLLTALTPLERSTP